MLPSDLNAVSSPGYRDGFQGLNLIEPGWGVEVGAVICQGKYVRPIQKPHESQGPVFKSPEQPGCHIDGLGFDVCNVVIEAAAFLERHPQILHLLDHLDSFAV